MSTSVCEDCNQSPCVCVNCRGCKATALQAELDEVRADRDGLQVRYNNVNLQRLNVWNENDDLREAASKSKQEFAALQAELDAANRKCAALIDENALSEAIIWRKCNEIEAKHAVLMAGVDGLAGELKKSADTGPIYGSTILEYVSGRLHALLTGME
jgi:chromosome segregation ATPase